MNISELFDGVQHIGLPTKCFDRTVAFYQNLGFTQIYSTLNNGQHVAFLKQGNLVVETYESAEAAEKAGAWDHVALSCSDIESAFRITNYKFNNKKSSFLLRKRKMWHTPLMLWRNGFPE